MPLTPDAPFPKTQGDNIRSKDWNDAVTEVVRLDNAKVNRTGSETLDGPLAVNANLRSVNLMIGAWPANPAYQFVGVTTLNQGVGGNYALLQGSTSDPGTTFLNSPQTVRLRIGNTDRAVLENNGNFTFNASTNPVRITDGWSAFPDGATNRAEICNDTGGYKTLMIVGNKSNGTGRRVSVWDRLEVNGELAVTGGLRVNGDLSVGGRIGVLGQPAGPRTAGWAGGLHTFDLEAEGTVWSRGGYQSGPRDLAENYPCATPLEPGDVVSLDPDSDRIVPAAGPNDAAVIGIVSSRPGMLLGSTLNDAVAADDPVSYPVALAGCVPCKVTDENGPIRRGDLLSAASKPGHAMRAPTFDLGGHAVHATGTVIGKALAAHPEGGGVGMIEVFVMLR